MTYDTTNRKFPTRNNWQDWANLILAIWLFFSPWILQFGGNASTQPPVAGAHAINAVSNAAWNAWILGVLVFIVALSGIGRMELWQERINAVLGAWIFIAPWVLGFSGGRFPGANWDHWIVGALIFLIALSGLFSPRPETREVPRRPFDRR